MSRGLVDSKIIPRLWNICSLAFQMGTAQNFNRFMENKPIRDFFSLHSSINNHNAPANSSMAWKVRGAHCSSDSNPVTLATCSEGCSQQKPTSIGT
jgi:hypothetical protein